VWRRASTALLAALVLAGALVAGAAAEDVYSERTLQIARELNCPICAGQSVADSQSELAVQMRAIIEQKVQAGESDAEIKAYFVERYGESILAAPPKSGFTLTLWWVPVIGVLLGAGILALYLRERTRRPPSETDPSKDDAELEALAREILGDERRPVAESSGGAR
jgi:cytochrome c-type biogenesis protein CcmH